MPDHYSSCLGSPAATEAPDRPPIQPAVTQVEVKLLEFEAIQQRKGQLAGDITVRRAQIQPRQPPAQASQTQERTGVLRARQWQPPLDPRHLVLKLVRLPGYFIYVGRRQTREVPFYQHAQRVCCQ
ncbi:hypothetical protein D3C80_575330 [compost metagenome]